MSKVLQEVLEERERQEGKWGIQNHEPFGWIAILTEEVGEVSRAALESTPKGSMIPQRGYLTDYRKELIQVAAVAVAMVECLDRDEWQ